MELCYAFLLSIKETHSKLKGILKSPNLELNRKDNLLTINHFIRVQTNGGLPHYEIGPHSFRKPYGLIMLMKCNSFSKNIL